MTFLWHVFIHSSSKGDEENSSSLSKTRDRHALFSKLITNETEACLATTWSVNLCDLFRQDKTTSINKSLLFLLSHQKYLTLGKYRDDNLFLMFYKKKLNSHHLSIHFSFIIFFCFIFFYLWSHIDRPLNCSVLSKSLSRRRHRLVFADESDWKKTCGGRKYHITYWSARNSIVRNWKCCIPLLWSTQHTENCHIFPVHRNFSR